jgi:hypothetical protein
MTEKIRTYAKATDLGIAEDLVAVLDNKLDSVISRLHICHLALKAMVTHDGRREDHGKILRGHLSDVSEATLGP